MLTITGNSIPQFTRIGNGSLSGIVPYPFIVGGTSLAGARGRIVGTIVGFIILGIVNNMMIMLNTSPCLSAKMLESIEAVVKEDTERFEITVKNAVDDADQQNRMQTFKEGKYDMICILPGNGTLMTQICSEIYKAGTKIMIIDGPIEGEDYTVFCGGDNKECGRNGARYIGQRLGGKGQIAVLRS